MSNPTAVKKLDIFFIQNEKNYWHFFCSKISVCFILNNNNYFNGRLWSDYNVVCLCSTWKVEQIKQSICKALLRRSVTLLWENIWAEKTEISCPIPCSRMRYFICTFICYVWSGVVLAQEYIEDYRLGVPINILTLYKKTIAMGNFW